MFDGLLHAGTDRFSSQKCPSPLDKLGNFYSLNKVQTVTQTKH